MHSALEWIWDIHWGGWYHLLSLGLASVSKELCITIAACVICLCTWGGYNLSSRQRWDCRRNTPATVFGASNRFEVTGHLRRPQGCMKQWHSACRHVGKKWMLLLILAFLRFCSPWSLFPSFATFLDHCSPQSWLSLIGTSLDQNILQLLLPILSLPCFPPDYESTFRSRIGKWQRRKAEEAYFPVHT